MDEPITVISCKNCREYVEIPKPIKERCVCGLTADTRLHRNWAIVLAFVITIVASAIVCGLTADRYLGVKQNELALEQHRVQANEDIKWLRAQRDQAVAEIAELKKQTEKYQMILDTLKGVPQVAEAVKSAQAEKK